MSTQQKSKRDLMWEQRKQARESKSQKPASNPINLPVVVDKSKLGRGKDKLETTSSVSPVPQTKGSLPDNTSINKHQSQGPIPNDNVSRREESLTKEDPSFRIPTDDPSFSPFKGRSLERSPKISPDRNGVRNGLDMSHSQNGHMNAVDLEIMNEKQEEKKKKHDYAEFLRHQMIEKYQQRVKLRNQDRDIPEKIGQRNEEERVAQFERKKKEQYAEFLRLQMKEKEMNQKKAMYESMDETRHEVSPPPQTKGRSYTPVKQPKHTKSFEPEYDEYEEEIDTRNSHKNIVPHPPQDKKALSRKEPEKPIVNRRNIFQEQALPSTPPERGRRTFHQRKYNDNQGHSLNHSLMQPDEIDINHTHHSRDMNSKERALKKMDVSFSPNRERDFSGEGAQSHRSRKGEKIATDGTRGFLLDSEHPMIIAAKEKVKKDYQREIKEQIEQKRRMKEAEQRKRIHEEQMEELRVQREQEELALKFMREKEGEILKNKLQSEEKAEIHNSSHNNLNYDAVEQSDAPKIVFRNGRKMILTPEQEQIEKMQKELAEKEEIMRKMQQAKEVATKLIKAPPTELHSTISKDSVRNPSLRNLPVPLQEPLMNQTHGYYNGPNPYIVPQPLVMQFPQNIPPNPDNELKKEIQELKAEVSKYSTQLIQQIREAKDEASHAAEERNRAEIELIRLKEEMRLRAEQQKREEFTTLEAMDPNIIQKIQSIGSNDDYSHPHTLQSQDLNPQYRMPDTRKELYNKQDLHRDHEHMNSGSKNYVHTGGSEISVPTNPNTGSNAQLISHPISKKLLHENPSSSDITVSLMHQTKLVPFNGLDHLNYDPIQPKPRANVKEKIPQNEVYQQFASNHEDPLGIEIDRKKVPVQNQRGSLEYPNSSIGAHDSITGQKQSYQDHPIKPERPIQEHHPKLNSIQQKIETENKLKGILNSLPTKSYDVSPNGPPSKFHIPHSNPLLSSTESKTKTPKKVETDLDIWPRTDQSAQFTPKTDTDTHPVPNNLGKVLYPVVEEPNAELQTTMMQYSSIREPTGTSFIKEPSSYNPSSKEYSSNRETSLRTNNSTNRDTRETRATPQPQAKKEALSALNKSVDYQMREKTRPNQMKSDPDNRSNSIGTPQNPSSQPVQTLPKLHPNSTRENNPSQHTQSSRSNHADKTEKIRSNKPNGGIKSLEEVQPAQQNSIPNDERKSPYPETHRYPYYPGNSNINGPTFNPASNLDFASRRTPQGNHFTDYNKFPVFENKPRNTIDSTPKTANGYVESGHASSLLNHNGLLKDTSTPSQREHGNPVTLLQNKASKVSFHPEVDRDKSPNRWQPGSSQGKNSETFSHAGMQVLQGEGNQGYLEKEAQTLKHLQIKKDPYEDYPQIRASMEERGMIPDNKGMQQVPTYRDIFATIQDGQPKKNNVFGHKYNPILNTSSKDLLAVQRGQLNSADSNFNARDIQMKNEMRLERLEKFGLNGLDDSKEDIFQVRGHKNTYEHIRAREALNKSPMVQSVNVNSHLNEEDDEITRLDNLLRKHMRQSQMS